MWSDNLAVHFGRSRNEKLLHSMEVGLCCKLTFSITLCVLATLCTYWPINNKPLICIKYMSYI